MAARIPWWIRISAAIGALWGFAGYALLWGHTPVFVHRPFVESVPGTVVLLPVRSVLWTIHALERMAGRPFDLSANNWWIGLVAAASGAALIVAMVFIVRRIAGLARSGGEEIPEATQGL